MDSHRTVYGLDDFAKISSLTLPDSDGRPRERCHLTGLLCIRHMALRRVLDSVCLLQRTPRFHWTYRHPGRFHLSQASLTLSTRLCVNLNCRLVLRRHRPKLVIAAHLLLRSVANELQLSNGFICTYYIGDRDVILLFCVYTVICFDFKVSKIHNFPKKCSWC